MSLRWILPTVALALPALAQEPSGDVAPAAEAPEAPKQEPKPEPKAQPAPEAQTVASEPAAKSEPAATAVADAPADAPVAAPRARKTAVPVAAQPEPAKATPTAGQILPPPNQPGVPHHLITESQGPAARAAAAMIEKNARDAAVNPRPASGSESPPQAQDALAAAMALDNETPAQTVSRIARVAFEKFLSGDARFLVGGAGYPFSLDGRRFDEREALFRELLQQLRARRTDLLSVDAVEVLTPDEMEKKHGKPPARLAALPWRAPNTWIAVGNLSGIPVVAIFQLNPRTGWKLIAFTD